MQIGVLMELLSLNAAGHEIADRETGMLEALHFERAQKTEAKRRIKTLEAEHKVSRN